MNEIFWECDHCGAIFRAENNLCVSCGAPSGEYTKKYGNPPILVGDHNYLSIVASCAVAEVFPYSFYAAMETKRQRT